MGSSSSKSVSGSTSGATPSSGIASLSGLTPPITMQSSWGGIARLVEAIVRRRGNGPISSSRRDTGNTWRPTVINNGTLQVRRILDSQCLKFTDRFLQDSYWHIWFEFSWATPIPAQQSGHDASILDRTELVIRYHAETGPPPVT